MFGQGTTVTKTHATVTAHIRFLPSVNSHVCSQGASETETLSTFIALIRFLPSVNVHVLG